MELKHKMKEVMKEMDEKFLWLQTKEEIWQLFYVYRCNGEESLHPWIEVKESSLTQAKDVYLAGVFALRDFKTFETIGFYNGEVTKPSKHKDSVFVISFGDTTHVDIPHKDNKRLTYGMGMHLCNDVDWPNGYDNNSINNNNAVLCADLVVQSSKPIKKGEEITICYNLTTDEENSFDKT